MNEQFQGTAEQLTAERINTLDPARRDLSGAGDLQSLDGLSADELEKLIAIRPVGDDLEGERIIGYVTVDAADEADEDKTIH